MAEVGTRDEKQTVDVETADHEKAAIGAYAGFIVKRDRLIHELAENGRAVGVTILCAPKGFGKTALLLQYVAVVKSDPTRGDARIVDGAALGKRELETRLGELRDQIPAATHPLVAIDGLPRLGRDDAERIARSVRAMREQGFEVIIACTPASRAFVNLMGDTAKVGAAAMTVRPREYPQWAKTFSISPKLDVYGLTQGIPALVALLQAATEQQRGDDLVEVGVVELYRAVLDELRSEKDPLYRLVSLMIMVGKGSLADFERSGMRMRSETVNRLARDYPMFGLDTTERTYACLGGEGGALLRLRRDLSHRRPTFAAQAIRVLMRAGRVDATVRLCQKAFPEEEAMAVVVRYPGQLALAGHGAFMSDLLSRGRQTVASGLEVGALLAAYLAALTMGEYRLARSAATELARRAEEVRRQVDPETWDIACAMREVWGPCSGIDLPAMPADFTKGSASGMAAMLRDHVRIFRALVAGDGEPEWRGVRSKLVDACEDELDIPRMLLEADCCLDESFHAARPRRGHREALEALTDTLVRRRLAPLAVRLRMVTGVARLFAEEPLVDERCFIDAGALAVRESDLAVQAFCMCAEGWQALALDQAVNAQFRGQQVQKLALQEQGFVQAWAILLERAAHVHNTSRVGIREEADVLELTEKPVGPAEAWGTALVLSAARNDSELSAWYSLHKAELLEERFRPCARLALDAVGNRSEAVTRLIPARELKGFALKRDVAGEAATLFDVMPVEELREIGMVSISMFGGFRVERNGHIVTDEMWRRKKASVLAARLALALGSFVSRRTITEEMWPEVPYRRARENLYVALSALRAALGQSDAGPQYVLTQGEGVALNPEFVNTDVRIMETLSREVLLRQSEAPAQQIIEACLKIEQLYTGPLYVPDNGNPEFFARMRRMYLSKFIDCMIQGIDAALADERISSASWLVEAGLRQAPMREDLLRRAFTVFDACGRRREVVELYNSHLHYVEHELHGSVEEETQRAYERVIGHAKQGPML